MKVPVKWLKDYVDIDISPQELGDKLTLSGSKVEEVIISGAEIQNVVTGKIIEIVSHPDADKLVVCQVDIGLSAPTQIVTAATNMKENDIVPVALHQSTLHGGAKIKKGKLRGILSNGMFCSEEELGIAVDEPVEGLMILPKDTPLGKDIKEVLNLQSVLIDFEITSNRADCLSIIGIARETAATLGTEYRKPALDYKATAGENVEDIYKVEVKDELCKRYMLKGIKNVKIEPSPQWMQERLIEAEIRPINNIVDITNFVMVELGQPMHAFDARQITTNNIVIERASNGEKFTTLDEKERELDDSILTIKDGDRTIGLAGIMGGLNSEIKEDTTSVIFEGANFDGVNIRLASKKLLLRTDASSKFEKDLDPNMAEMAINRACHLVEELGTGEIMQGCIDVYPKIIKSHTLEVDINWINTFLGTNISKYDMKSYLDRLELTTEIIGNFLIVQAPTHRSDINIREDIAEEIARIYGYDNIPSTLPNCETSKSGKSEKQKLEDRVVLSLTASSLNQSISYSFVSPKIFDKLLVPEESELRKVVTIKNPLGEDYSIMRTTTIASMMDCLSRNYSRNNEEVRLFEIGKVYIPDACLDKLPEERNILTIGMYGNVDYLDLKGVVENVLDNLGIKNASYKRESENPTYHPGKTSNLYVKREFVGVVGEIHPSVSENYDVLPRCYIAELNLDVLYKNTDLNNKYKSLPKFPAVTRDIALLVDDEVLVQDIEDIIVKQGGNILESVKLFDVYKGKQIAEGKKSIAYAIVYRRSDKTLTDDEVNKVHEKILRTLENKVGAELRE
ncbi:phenylalanine--tRNA ligase subunit beta [Clostridium estertheticum]|uniref:phenylalanine--tRNA ligase subunit beta n=1 Tax=Clostridium estertheticum TaxID=238834 RepID=UPI001C7D665E|nr:phenylalanine--tRNA ligase subunit beta [Clostridium estertheticum]MBX4259324.1 phenylalanine--tRNA ligase subunit beta [Clostridium estertheticum]WLC69413.1 phenylalanine--tRNA ligase subunit beta [Clostridium estertheticum]